MTKAADLKEGEIAALKEKLALMATEHERLLANLASILKSLDAAITTFGEV